MSKRNERGPADEYKYDEQLRREESVKTEVIQHLRGERDAHLKSQAALLGQVMDYGRLLVSCIQALEVYRQQMLTLTNRAIERQSRCSTNCDCHEWDNVHGWREKVSK